MKLSELLDGLKWRPAGVNPDVEVISPATDSRAVSRGSLFICIAGTKRDGHRFAADAVAAGAVAVVCERPLAGLPCVITEDTRAAAALIWSNSFGAPGRHMRITGITGTNGKTSTAVFLDSIFNEAGVKSGLIGTLGCSAAGEKMPHGGAELEDAFASMTTPDPEFLYGTLAEMRRRGADTAVMEVSSHALAQKKTDALSFDCGVFTNLSPEHMDFHGNMEDYYRTKASMFDRCKSAVVNVDDKFGLRLARELHARGLEVNCVSARTAGELCIGANGFSCRLRIAGADMRIKSTIAGHFTVYNTMLAANAALAAGVEAEYIERGIAAVKGIPGRMERLALGGLTVFIDYAHTPEALRAALVSLRGLYAGRLTVLFGCGGDRDSEKRPVMGHIAEKLADRVIVTSDNPRKEKRSSIISDITAGMVKQKHTVIENRAEAIRYAVETAEHDEVILLAGKGHEDYETDADGKHPFSEKEILREAAKKHRTASQ